jgi:hypothetical protein
MSHAWELESLAKPNLQLWLFANNFQAYLPPRHEALEETKAIVLKVSNRKFPATLITATQSQRRSKWKQERNDCLGFEPLAQDVANPGQVRDGLKGKGNRCSSIKNVPQNLLFFPRSIYWPIIRVRTDWGHRRHLKIEESGSHTDYRRTTDVEKREW